MLLLALYKMGILHSTLHTYYVLKYIQGAVILSQLSRARQAGFAQKMTTPQLLSHIMGSDINIKHIKKKKKLSKKKIESRPLNPILPFPVSRLVSRSTFSFVQHHAESRHHVYVHTYILTYLLSTHATPRSNPLPPLPPPPLFLDGWKKTAPERLSHMHAI